MVPEGSRQGAGLGGRRVRAFLAALLIPAMLIFALAGPAMMSSQGAPVTDGDGTTASSVVAAHDIACDAAVHEPGPLSHHCLTSPACGACGVHLTAVAVSPPKSSLPVPGFAVLVRPIGESTVAGFDSGVFRPPRV